MRNLILVLCLAAAAGAQETDRIEFTLPFEKALAKAKAENKLLFLKSIYGCIVTTDGQMKVAFGFGLVEVFRAFQQTIEPSEAEQAVLDGDDFLAASKLAAELLMFEKAHALAAKAGDTHWQGNAQKVPGTSSESRHWVVENSSL